MCDCFIALSDATKNNDIIFAKNSDREFYEAHQVVSIPRKSYAPGEKIALTYIEIDQVAVTNEIFISKPHWIWGAEMGVNEYGLMIGNEAIFSPVSAEGPDGIIGMDLLRLALERAMNVDEAVTVITDLLEQHGQAGNCGYKEECRYHNAFLIADPNGGVILETIDRDWVVRPANNVDAISNALTVRDKFIRSSDMLESNTIKRGLLNSGETLSFKKAYEDVGDSEFGNQRRQFSLSVLEPKQGKITITDAFKHLRSHGDPNAIDQNYGDMGRPRLCVHMKGSFLDATTGSMVSSLSEDKQIHWVTATPAACTSLFKPFLVGLELPQHGPLPGEAEDQNSLWWRHETLRLFLLNKADKEDIDRFEHERDGLEKEFVRLMDACPTLDSIQSRQECQEAVNSCWQRAEIFESKWYVRALSAQ